MDTGSLHEEVGENSSDVKLSGGRKGLLASPIAVRQTTSKDHGRTGLTDLTSTRDRNPVRRADLARSVIGSMNIPLFPQTELVSTNVS